VGPRDSMDWCGKLTSKIASVIQGFHKRMLGFKASTEENLVRKKEKMCFVLLQKPRISHGLYNT
jgi:hypothetical protein